MAQTLISSTLSGKVGYSDSASGNIQKFEEQILKYGGYIS